MTTKLSDLSVEGIRARLPSDSMFDSLVVLESIPSTNDELRRLAAAGAAEGTVVAADAQTAGRGRLGRTWYSPAGFGLYISSLFRPPGAPAILTRYTLGTAVAACEACRRLGAAEVTIEWPNDLRVGRLKLGGVLAEARAVSGSERELVLGLGLNVHHGFEDFPADLPATSLRLAGSQGMLSRNELAAAYLEELGRVVQLLIEGRWPEVAARWEQLAPAGRDRSVRVSRGPRDGESFCGTTMGLDNHGALLVRRRSGEVVSVHEAGSVIAS